MTTRFYYEDGQGRMVDEQGNDAMDWVEEVTPFHLKTLTRIREYCEKQEDEQLSSQVALKNLDIDMENLKEDKGWNIFEKQTNLVNRPKSQLDDRHKLHLLDFYDNWTHVLIVDAMDSLTQKLSDLSVKKSTVHNFLKTECNLSFKKLAAQPAARNSPTKIQNRKDWVIKWSATDMNYLENCVFVDESGFNISMRPPSGWSLKGKPALTDTPTGRAVSHTVLGATTAKFVVSMEFRNPKKKPQNELKLTSVIVKEKHQLKRKSQLQKLNPIEQFWLIVKNKVKRSSLEATEDLATQIAEAYEWAMKKFNLDQLLAQQTISNILKNAETLYSNINVVKNGKSLKTTRYPQLDDEVVKFIADMNNNNLPVNQDSILRYRIGVKCRPMHGESASVDITSENIQNELKKIEELLGPCDPADIMKFDETGLYYQQPPRRTICSKSLDGLKILNVAFGRQNRKIALLLGNASVHKIRIQLNNIKLIFLLANTTSKLQALDAEIIDNFKAHFRAQQYDRALCLHITNEWLKVKPETINGILPDLPRNFDNKVTDVSRLNLEADESEMTVCYTTSTTNDEETAKGNVDETEENGSTEQDEHRVDIVECKKRLRETYGTILIDVAINNGSVVINNYERSNNKKQKVDHTDESKSWEIENLEDLLDAWRHYLSASNDKYEYCLEKYHIIECGYSIKCNPKIPEELYNQIGLSEECIVESPFISCFSYCSKILDYMKTRAWKEVESAVIGSQDEKLELVKEQVDFVEEYFRFCLLLSKENNLYKHFNISESNFIDEEDNEMFLLETSGKLMLNEKWKYGYDHVKCTFGALSIFNAAFKKYFFAAEAMAMKLQIPYLHAMKDSLHLWVLELCSNKLYISNKIKLERVHNILKAMKEEHDSYEIQRVLEGSSSSRLLLVEMVGTEIQKPVKGEGYDILLPEEKDESDCNVQFTNIKNKTQILSYIEY
ncbi:hypothetical protein G6F46_007552 [Rhizopus delemar]|nr:hypothetical protein G6F55_007752 [Rhizopus delemar]KAG1507889.1 hypothetical protein G6F53_008607 [Rhizopus delemar]KAG1562069.1 hypothetical protein G6F49_001235 [Rhizopus delemar]KAG1572077.1 hypothetical protein G6F50_004055 [Rhizopus delemar]KAG1604925.1 hypothetical protein G6F47_000463 [Rhizopus delemar]